MVENGADDDETLAEFLDARVKPDWLVRLEKIENQVSAEVPDEVWQRFADRTGLTLADCKASLSGTVADIRHSLIYPSSKRRIERDRLHHSQLATLSKMIGQVAFMYSRLEHHIMPVVGHTRSLHERFSKTYRRFIERTSDDADVKATAAAHADFFGIMLSLLELETTRLIDEVKEPGTPGRPKFPERQNCAESAVSLWLHLRWEAGFRAEHLLPTKKNLGFLFITELLDLGFKPNPVAPATINNLAKRAIAEVRGHALDVSAFMEAELRAGREVGPAGPGFDVGPYDALIRYLKASSPEHLLLMPEEAEARVDQKPSTEKP